MSSVGGNQSLIGSRNSVGNNSVNGRREIIDVTRKLYRTDFEMFLVNNLIMAVVPFDNYDEDLKLFQSKDSPREMEIAQLNEEFENKHNKSLLYPDTFFENVNKNMLFQRCDDKHGTSLIPERILVVDKMVDVNEKSDETTNDDDQNINDESSEENDQTIKVEWVYSERPGYVKLENRVYRKSTVSSIFSRPSSEPRSSSGGSSVSYGIIDAIRTKEPLGDIDSDLIGMRKILFIAMRNENYSRRPSSTLSEDRTEERFRRHDEYMSSRNYANKFRCAFRKTIGYALGLDLQNLSTESMRETFYCQSADRNDNVINYEITSAIDINWPDKLTMNWFVRERNEMVDRNTNRRLKWPSDNMRLLARVEKCLILPRYAIQKHHRTKEEDIEWEIAFPRAEKYLQSTLSHSQTKTYLMLVLLHRSFIEPVTQYTGLNLEHIKMVFYWELETSFVSFPETRMGSKLIDILQKLYDKILAFRRLDHYFYGGMKNVFDSIPNQHIATAQEIVHNILNNKVSYIIAALCNLRYKATNRFPQFDFAKLHRILTQDNLVSTINGRKSSNSRRSSVRTSAEKPKEWINLQERCIVGSEETIRKVKSLKMFIEHFIEIGRVSFKRSRRQLGRAYYLQAKDLTTILDEQGNHDDDVKKFKVAIEIGCPDL